MLIVLTIFNLQIKLVTIISDNIQSDISEIGNSLRFLARRLSHFTYTINVKTKSWIRRKSDYLQSCPYQLWQH